jgi:hypothetical protein
MGSCDHLPVTPVVPLNPAIKNMTLRDWFAGQVILHDGGGEYSPAEFAKAAYALADAMLTEREKS